VDSLSPTSPDYATDCFPRPAGMPCIYAAGSCRNHTLCVNHICPLFSCAERGCLNTACCSLLLWFINGLQCAHLDMARPLVHQHVPSADLAHMGQLRAAPLPARPALSPPGRSRMPGQVTAWTFSHLLSPALSLPRAWRIAWQTSLKSSTEPSPLT